MTLSYRADTGPPLAGSPFAYAPADGGRDEVFGPGGAPHAHCSNLMASLEGLGVAEVQARWDRARRADFHNFGHYHQYLNMGHIANNGSLCGFNGYAMSIKASPEPPQQAFYLVDSKRGKTCCSPIWAGDVEEEARLWKEAA